MPIRVRAGAVTLLIGTVLLTSCGGAGGPSGSAAADPSVAPTSSVADATGAQVARALGSIEGAPLGYLEYLPPGYGDGEAAPLLVFLHGGGEYGDGSEAALGAVATNGVPALIRAGLWPDDRPFVVLSPQYGEEAAQGECDIGADLDAFLTFAVEHYEVDRNRVYLTGISCGAIGMWDYLAAHTDEVVAAAVPIAGHAEWALEKTTACDLGRVPVWAFHGALDEVVPVVNIEGPMDQIRACEDPAPAEMELTVYPDADHDSWSRTYDLSAGHDIYAWLLEHEHD